MEECKEKKIAQQVTDVYGKKLKKLMKRLEKNKMPLSEIVREVKGFVDSMGEDIIKAYLEEIYDSKTKDNQGEKK